MSAGDPVSAASKSGLDRRPRHRAIAEALRQAIRAGEYPVGSQLPSELDLTRRYAVSRGTVRHALAALKAEGAVLSRPGARAVVLGESRSQSFSELISFSAWAESLGELPAGRVVSLARHLADADEAVRLDIRHSDVVFRLVRVRSLGETPVMIERTSFPDQVGRRVAALDLERSSIYAELGRQGVLFAHARHIVSAIAADDDDADLLDLPPRTPLLRQLRRTASPSGQVLEWSDDRYRADAVSFLVENSSSSWSSGALIPHAVEP